MACGSGGAVEFVDRANVCAVMCDHCREAVVTRDGWAHGCRITGMTVSAACRRYSHCPRERLPDADGIVRWLGIRWYGVPYPLRVWRWQTRFNDVEFREYMARIPQCGCIVVLKDWWEGKPRRIDGEFTVFRL